MKPYVVLRTYVVNVPELGEPGHDKIDAWLKDTFQDLEQPLEDGITEKGVAIQLTYAADIGDMTEFAVELDTHVIDPGGG